ncbi:hypothetical protein LSUE1_G004314 [Lachnellula suecica]|uniref:Rhodopsin domain-containing protein n=1 Tax=Lachnellula suecica TaxID=602035 RepID=A0A8T9C4V2_9HELO|nr:hypothetical protein LSUE1_G004314 [Lachnellula suecica]
MSQVSDVESALSARSLGPAIVESMWILMSIASLVVAARFYVRAHLIKNFASDDWVIMLSFVLTIVATICFTIAVHYGLGRHENLLSPAASVMAFKWNLIGQVIGILSATFARISFCMMLFAITSVQQRVSRILLWTIVITQLILNVALSIFILAQCQPITKLWDHTTQGTCLAPQNQEHFGFFQGSINSATDLALAIFPATIIWNLNMRIAVKLSLIITMGLGIFTMVASVVKTIYLKGLARVSDYSYETSYLIIWFCIEIWLLITAASIPTLRPLLLKSRRTLYDSNGNRGTVPSLSNNPSRWDRRKHFSNLESDHIELTEHPQNARIEVSCRSSEGDKACTISPEGNSGLGGITRTVELEISY